MPRTPVRGQKSREVVKEAKRKKRVEESAAWRLPPDRVGPGRIAGEGPGEEGRPGYRPGHRGGRGAQGERPAAPAAGLTSLRLTR